MQARKQKGEGRGRKVFPFSMLFLEPPKRCATRFSNLSRPKSYLLIKTSRDNTEMKAVFGFMYLSVGCKVVILGITHSSSHVRNNRIGSGHARESGLPTDSERHVTIRSICKNTTVIRSDSNCDVMQGFPRD